MKVEETLAGLCHRPAPRSFWRAGLATRASPLTVHEYLIDEANLRGFWGAFRATTPDRATDDSLELEDVVAGLLAAQAPVDARVFKLVLRILQSGRLLPQKLLLRSKREGAWPALYWLLQKVPSEECNDAVRGLQVELSTPPRAYRGLDYNYDAQRLVRRPAKKDDLWRKPPRSS